MSTEDIAPRGAENSENSGGQLWNSIAGLLCCCTSSAARAPGVDIAAKEPKSKGDKKDKTPKKKSKGNDSSSSDDNTNLFQSEETLFGKQWFGYSRKVSKKGKSLQKNTNLDDVGTETKPIDTNIMKAKMDVRQRQKRAPSAQHMKRMISHDVFDNNVPQDTVKAAEEQPQSEASKTIPEENPVEAKTEETPEKVESSESPEQKPNGEAKTPEGKPEDVVVKQENPAATKEEVVTSASGETAKENTTAETSDSEKSNETKNVTKDVTEVTVTSSDVTMTPDDAVGDAAVTPVDVKGISDLKPQDTVDTSSSAAAVTSTAPTVAKDETLDSPLSPPMTKESPAESSPPKTNNDKEPVLSNQENGSPATPPREPVLQPNEKNTTPVEEKEEENVLNVETSKNKEQAEETKKDERTEKNKNDERTEENKNDGGSRPEAQPAEIIKDEQEKAEKTEPEKGISSSESHLPAEAMIKAQET